MLVFLSYFGSVCIWRNLWLFSICSESRRGRFTLFAGGDKLSGLREQVLGSERARESTTFERRQRFFEKTQLPT
jgi:hypothetical protein